MGGVHNACTSASSHMVLHKDQRDDNFSEQKALQTACGATVYASYNLVPCIQAALTEAMPVSGEIRQIWGVVLSAISLQFLLPLVSLSSF